jgi:hypothetical protein
MRAKSVRARNDSQLHCLERTDWGRSNPGGGYAVQTARPRDVGALVFVVGLFVVLTLITVLVPGH